jgi:hypothetical protein
MQRNFNPKNRLSLNKFHQVKPPISAQKAARKKKRDL